MLATERQLASASSCNAVGFERDEGSFIAMVGDMVSLEVVVMGFTARGRLLVCDRTTYDTVDARDFGQSSRCCRETLRSVSIPMLLIRSLLPATKCGVTLAQCER
jgi:hypothetical protein